MNKRTTPERKTTFWDFLIALGSGIVNLLKIEKVICLVILYLMGRDFYFTKNIDKGEVYQNNVLDVVTFFKLVLENDDKKDIIYLSIIASLMVIILIFIMVIRCVYMVEINRLVKERMRLLHDMETGNFTPLHTHRSSDEDDNNLHTRRPSGKETKNIQTRQSSDEETRRIRTRQSSDEETKNLRTRRSSDGGNKK